MSTVGRVALDKARAAAARKTRAAIFLLCFEVAPVEKPSAFPIVRGSGPDGGL